MAAEVSDFVIVGAGLAGAKAAETLRDEGFDGRVVLIGDEQDRPYERPPLSKGYLAGNDSREGTFVHDAGWYTEHDVELVTGVAATGIDTSERTVTLADGQVLGYRRLLLATGATPRQLPRFGLDMTHDSVLALRRLGDADQLRTTLTEGTPRVAIIGGGWIGLEVAAAARGYGCEVDILETAPTPLYGALGEELGQVFASLHLEHGVRLHTDTSLAEARRSGDVWHLVTEGGPTLEADLVVLAVGAAPCTDLAEGAGLRVDDGVVVDAALRSSAPDVFAAGDVASAYHPHYGRHVRVEHWANALAGGPVAARAMLGQQASHDQLPYFFTDQYDLGMEFSGLATPGSYQRVVYRGDVEGREFIAFWLGSGDEVLAGMNVNVWDVTEPIQALITSKAPVDVDRLTDPDVPLTELKQG